MCFTLTKKAKNNNIIQLLYEKFKIGIMNFRKKIKKNKFTYINNYV